MKRLFILSLFPLLLLVNYQISHACGGLFCQTVPVSQQAERIIFSQGDGTVTSLIEIQYTGDAPDFSWILPLPNAIAAEDITVPETAVNAFEEIQRLTDVQILLPQRPSCTQSFTLPFLMGSAVDMESATDTVEIFASGEVGPYGFVVIGSEDPDALVDWLRENEYRVDPPMEPLIDVYVDEGFVFLAMRLLPEETADSIKPIQITYQGEKPMIPLRLTAVAAEPNMAIYAWIYADQQAVPENYDHMRILDGEITAFDFGGHDYQQIVRLRANALGGRAFITEYAQPTANLDVNDPILRQLHTEHQYLTRLYTVMDPFEMTVDPVFGYDNSQDNVSNIRDLRDLSGIYQCEREKLVRLTFTDAIEAVDRVNNLATAEPPANPTLYAARANVSTVAWDIFLIGLAIILGRAGLTWWRRRQ
ncbi:MAG TPA: DUF2330 domain-containing protein [Anaerolineae bacterium]|nr:DUF2330 domain-containing protein [Anaerolineae bacterium]